MRHAAKGHLHASGRHGEENCPKCPRNTQNRAIRLIETIGMDPKTRMAVAGLTPAQWAVVKGLASMARPIRVGRPTT